jgi:hypothetical protein
MRNYALDLRGLNLMRPWPLALRAYLDQAGFAQQRPSGTDFADLPGTR